MTVSPVENQMKQLQGLYPGEIPETTSVKPDPIVDRTLISKEMEPVLALPESVGLGESLFGAGFKSKQDFYDAVDPKLVTPNISITEVMDFKDPEVVGMFNKAELLIDARGNPYDVKGKEITEKIKIADQWGAVSFVDSDNDENEIKWYRAVENMTKIPEGLDSGVLKNGVPIDTTDLTTSDLERVRFASMMISTNLMNPKVGRPLYAGFLNNMLVRNGVDARGRAMILRERLSDPTMGDLENVVVGGMDTIGRSVFETGLWGIGEVMDWFEGEQESKQGISDFRGRQAILDDMWPNLPDILQERYARKGVFIDLATAEDLAYTYSGLFPRAIRLAAEMMSVSKAGTAIRSALSTKQLAHFEDHLTKQLTKNPDLTLEEVYEDYEKTLKTHILSPLRLAGNLEKRMATAYQIKDASLPPKYRAEIQLIRKNQTQLLKQKRILTRKQNRSYSPATKTEIERLDDSINRNKISLTEAERYTSVPKFMRDIRVQDTYMTAGAAAAGHFFGQEFEMADPALAELVGLAVGGAVSLVKANTAQGLRQLNAYYTGDTSGRRKQMSVFVSQLSKANPNFALQIEANVTKTMSYFDKLEAQGIGRENLQASLPIIVDLVTLRHFADSVKKSLSSGDAFNMEIAEQFQESHETLRKLNGELNELIGDMSPDSDADATFFEFMRAMSRQGLKLQQNIDSDLKVINEKGVAHYLNALTSNSDILNDGNIQTLPEGVQAATFPQAVGSLMSRGIFDADQIDQASVESFAGNAVREVNDSLVTSAAQMRERIGVPSDLKGTLVGAIGQKRGESIPRNANASTLFAFQLEAANEIRHGQAMSRYSFLKSDNLVFVDANKNVLSGDIKVNAFDLIQEFLQLQKTGLDAGLPTSSIDKIINQVTDPVFNALAQEQGVPVQDILSDMKAELEKLRPGEFRFKPGRSLQAQVAEYVQVIEAEDGFDARMFEMSPETLRKFDRVVREEASKFNQSGKAGVATSLYNISDISIEGKFNQFTMDGKPIDTLMVRIPNEGDVPLKSYLDEAGVIWRQYKEDFHDKKGGSFIPRRLFADRQNLSQPDAQFPTNVSTAMAPSEWLKADDLFDSDKAARYMGAMNRALGTDVLFEGQTVRRLVEGESNTVAQQAIIRTLFAEWTEANILSGKVGPEEVAQAARSITNNLKMVDSNGVEKPLVNLMSIVDDHTRLSGKTFGNAKYEEVMEEASGLISSQLEASTERAKILSEGIADASNMMLRLTSDQISSRDIASELIRGGSERLSEIRRNLRSLTNEVGGTKYTPDQVDDILAHAYINGIRRELFVKTGAKEARVTKDASGQTKTTFVDMLVENPSTLVKYLGETDAEKAVARQILGNERYETIEAIGSVLSDLTDNPLAQSPVAVRGIPRAMSVESYISRLYAINRGVVRPQYVGTEAVLQQLRFSKHEFLTAMLTDPKLGRDFIEMVRTGEPLSPERDSAFRIALVQAYANSRSAFGGEKKDVVDPAGRKFTVEATVEDRRRMGYGKLATELDLPDVNTGSLTGPTAITGPTFAGVN